MTAARSLTLGTLLVHIALDNSVSCSFFIEKPLSSHTKQKDICRRGCRGGKGRTRGKSVEISENLKIFILSKHTLSSAEMSLLSHGPNFAPSNQPDPFVLFKGLNRYVRNLTLKRFFPDQKMPKSHP